jgi:hypothetical protein
MTAPEVIRQIESSWHEVPYPGDDHISTPASVDDDGITAYFRGTTWRGHKPADLRAQSSAFSFFAPEAFHYWLPAFMIAAIEDPGEADAVVRRIPWSLTDGRPPVQLSLFSPAQRQAVAAYLRFQIERFGDSAWDESEALRSLEGET